MDERVVVAGTTCDYIDWIRNKRPQKSVFITKKELRLDTQYPTPNADEEILIEDESYEEILQLLLKHCSTYGIKICGVAGYDCEALLLVSFLGTELKLQCVSQQAIFNCRQKIKAVNIWRKNGIDSPVTQIAETLDDALNFFENQLEKQPMVLKPLSGSGSEHTYLCKNEQQICFAWNEAKNAMSKRIDSPIFCERTGGSSKLIVEKFISGTEYSCDFYVPSKKMLNDNFQDCNNNAIVVRLCKKYPLPAGPFGTTGAYQPIPKKEWPVNSNLLEDILAQAARSVGFEKLICMADFIVHDGKPVLLEMAARPAGDCLLQSMTYCWNLDTVILVHDLAYNSNNINNTKQLLNCAVEKINTCSSNWIALRFFAQSSGVLKCINTDKLLSDSRVQKNSLYLIVQKDAVIKLPPDNYDSRILGHVVYIPNKIQSIELQNEQLRDYVFVEM